jgi:hypothetical protein
MAMSRPLVAREVEDMVRLVIQAKGWIHQPRNPAPKVIGRDEVKLEYMVFNTGIYSRGAG